MAEQRTAPSPAGRELPIGRDLPAPYEDPWRLLARDLRAVLASLRLRLWELSRRNRQGDLPVPAFWPRRLGSWFWPLALALVVAVVAALMVLVLNVGQEPRVLTAPPPPSVQLDEVTRSGQLTQNQESGNQASALPESQGQEPAGSVGGEDAAEPPPRTPIDRSGPPAPAATALPVPRPDPLLALLQPADPRQLVRAVRELPALAGLQLELAAGFQALAPAEQHSQAEAWRQKAADLGYERLELLDGSGRLLGRTARVGSGMILLDAVGAADVA